MHNYMSLWNLMLEDGYMLTSQVEQFNMLTPQVEKFNMLSQHVINYIIYPVFNYILYIYIL